MYVHTYVCTRIHTYVHTYLAYGHTFAGYAVAQWLGIRLQMLGVAMVTGVAFIAVLEHHFNTVNPGTYVRTYIIM